MSTTRSTHTDEELMRLPRDGRKYELVDGEIQVSPAGARHGGISVALTGRLHAFVKEHRLGHVFESSTGFRLPSGNLRCPDVSFVAAGRFPTEQLPEGFIEFAPDLAVEVLSPDDRPRQVLDKVGEYLEAGTRLVWVIAPRPGRATVYRSLTDVLDLRLPDGVLDGEDVVPGFRCPLSAILD
jgi:Uma2 family endonuclease